MTIVIGPSIILVLYQLKLTLAKVCRLRARLTVLRRPVMHVRKRVTIIEKEREREKKLRYGYWERESER